MNDWAFDADHPHPGGQSPAGLPDALDPAVADRVVQQLFRAAMEMHDVAGAAEGEAVARLAATLGELDRTVDEIRDAAHDRRWYGDRADQLDR